MQYTTLPRKDKDRIYKFLQRFKVKKSLIQNRSFYSREDYTPIPVTDITKIMKSLNDSLSPTYPAVQFNKSNPNFLYDFLVIMKEAISQGIEDEIPKEVRNFYDTIILPIAQSGKLKNKVKNLLSNLHDPLFTSDKAYQWMHMDYPVTVECGDYARFPTVRHFYYADICSNLKVCEQIQEIPTVQELNDFIRGCQKKGVVFKHNFNSLLNAFWHRCVWEPYRSMLINTGERPICYIDKDAYFGIMIRNNGTPAPYLQTAYRNLKVGKNKAGQALMQVRFDLLRHYPQVPRYKNDTKKSCPRKRAAVKRFIKETNVQAEA